MMKPWKIIAWLIALLCFVFLLALLCCNARGQDFLPKRSLRLTAGSSINPVFSGLVAYWKCDEASGFRGDATGNGWCAIERNGTQSGVSGIINNAVNVNTTGKGLSVSANLDTRAQTTAFSISFWVKDNGAWNTGNGLIAMILSVGTQGFLVYSGGSGGTMTPHWYTTNDAGTADDETASTLIGTGWNHIVVGFDGTTKRIYINGAAAGSSTVSGVSRGHQVFAIGNYSGFGSTTGQTATYDEIAYYSRMLSSSEVTTLYNSGAALAYSGSSSACTSPPYLGLNGTAPNCHYSALGYTDFYFTVDGSTPNPASIAHECDSNPCGDVDGVTGTLHITSAGTWGDSVGITIKMVGSNDGGVHVSSQLTFVTVTDCHLP